MKLSLFILTICFVSLSCEKSTNQPKSKIELIKENNSTPTVDIEKYYIINNSTENRKKDAEEILRLKRKWPQIMQSPTFKGFDTILLKYFTFVDNGHLFNRTDYINNRMKSSEWKITYVKYENLNLQFFGDIVLLTYRNHVKNENVKTRAIEIEHINWSDIYEKVDNKWKIRSAHVVEIKIEKVKSPNG